MLARVFEWLEHPWLYKLVQRLVGLGSKSTFVQEISAERQGRPKPQRVLDVGCGPASLLVEVGLEPVGLDVSISYAQALRKTGGVVVVGSANALPFPGGTFDEVWSIGLLHHLDDVVARRTIGELVRVTRRGGSTMVFDNVLPSLRPWTMLPFALRKMDRGRFVRSENALMALFTPDPDWTFRRLRYSVTGLEGLMCSRPGRERLRMSAKSPLTAFRS